MQLIQYRRSDGQIERIWSSNSQTLLAGHIPAEEETDFGYLWHDAEPITAADLVARWYVAAGELRAKAPGNPGDEPRTSAAGKEG